MIYIHTYQCHSEIGEVKIILVSIISMNIVYRILKSTMISLSVKIFRMPGTNEISNKVNFSCLYDATSKTSSWIMKYNGSEFQEVPECLYHCPGNPVENLPALVDFNWNAEHWSDSFPIFSCINGKHFKMSSQIYIQ